MIGQNANRINLGIKRTAVDCKQRQQRSVGPSRINFGKTFDTEKLQNDLQRSKF